MIDLKDKKISVFAHCEGGSGYWHKELFRFFLDNGVKEGVEVDFPFGPRSEKSITIEVVDSNKNVMKKSSLIRFYRPETLSFIKDFVYSLLYGFRYAKNSDYFIATDNLLVLSGLLLKKIGLVKKVIYVIIDYTPVRYGNKILNNIYFFLDKIAGHNCDQIWPLNEAMVKGRFRDGKMDEKKVDYIEVPFGNHSLLRKPEDYRIGTRKRIIFFGAIVKNKGADLFVPIAKALIRKGFSDFKFVFVGGGEVDCLGNEVFSNGLGEYFEIHGRIDDDKEVEKIMLGCGVAIAPYYPEDRNNFSYYADPGKIKFYLGCGLPIVITDVPPIAKEIEKRKCGLIAGYDSEDFASKIMEICNNEEKYAEFKGNSISFGREFDWKNIFNRLMEKI